jgi:hypothetical protein
LEAAEGHHKTSNKREGRWIEIVLWTDDTDAALEALVAKGAPILSSAHCFSMVSCGQDGSLIPMAIPSKLVQRKQ